MGALLTILLLLNACHQTPSPPLFWGLVVEGFPITEATLEEKEKETGISPQLILFYLQWQKTSQELNPTLELIWNRRAVPCITWEPISLGSGHEEMILIEELGEYENYIQEMAEQIRHWGKPLIIRLAHEMNLSRYHWGTSKEQFGPHSPETYIKMFRHVVDIFRKENVTNALFAFCPNVDSIPNESWNQVKNYYPGDAYVDILGMDGYNWNITPEIALKREMTWTSPTQSFETIFKPLYTILKKIAPTKPIIVFETATVSRKGESKTAWIIEAQNTAQKWGLEGIVWFQMNKEEDWRLNQNGDRSYLPYIISHPLQERIKNLGR